MFKMMMGMNRRLAMWWSYDSYWLAWEVETIIYIFLFTPAACLMLSCHSTFSSRSSRIPFIKVTTISLSLEVCNPKWVLSWNFLCADMFPCEDSKIVSVCPYPEKRNHLSFVNISPTLVIDTSMERSSRVLQYGNPTIWFSSQKKSKLKCLLTMALQHNILSHPYIFFNPHPMLINAYTKEFTLIVNSYKVATCHYTCTYIM